MRPWQGMGLSDCQHKKHPQQDLASAGPPQAPSPVQTAVPGCSEAGRGLLPSDLSLSPGLRRLHLAPGTAFWTRRTFPIPARWLLLARRAVPLPGKPEH